MRIQNYWKENMPEDNKFCIKCGKPIEVCPECEGIGWWRKPKDEVGFCSKCNGTGIYHQCNPEDVKETSFEERWVEDEEGRKDE